MDIVKLYGSLNENKLEIYVAEWKFIRETNSYFEVKSEIKTRRIKKEELNAIYSDTKAPYISFSVFCTVDKVNELSDKMVKMMEDQLIKQEASVKSKRDSFTKYVISK